MHLLGKLSAFAAKGSISIMEPSYGVMTRQARSKFLDWSGYTNQRHEQDDKALDESHRRILSLRASPDAKDPLFFWQIYSLTGREPVLEILTTFYNRVFDDEEAEWFRSIFDELSSKAYHIQVQTQMWIDCFGGGRLYGGGEFRLDFHHRESQAIELMNARGAERWVYHMKASLDQQDDRLKDIDERIRPAINSFLQFFIETYGKNFDFPTTPNLFGETCLP